MELEMLLLMDSPRSRRHRIRPKGGYRWPATHRVDASGMAAAIPDAWRL
jgi:hypothetical protein